MPSCASSSCSSGRRGVSLPLLAFCLQFPLPVVAFVEAVSIPLESYWPVQYCGKLGVQYHQPLQEIKDKLVPKQLTASVCVPVESISQLCSSTSSPSTPFTHAQDTQETARDAVLEKHHAVMLDDTELQTGWGGMAASEIICAVPLLRAGLVRAGCFRPCPAWFLIPPWTETPQPLWAASANASSPSQQKVFFLSSDFSYI